MSHDSKFHQVIDEKGLHLQRREVKTLQVNIGKKCNQACHHCHVEAGPKRTEMMTRATVDRLLFLLDQSPTITTVDITGGAPELNKNFCYLVENLTDKNIQAMDRCNLTVFFEEGQAGTPLFLKQHQVHVVASLPCYSKDNVDKQRGNGVFNKSIQALQNLNEIGYGQKDSNLKLDLVYNPVGAHLPPSQQKLEADYKKELKELFGIEFNQLYTITNMPIKRFLSHLEKTGQLTAYMDLLVNSFNPQAAADVMCRDLVSIGWDGKIYDCDFNQMLDMPLGEKPKTVFDIHSFNEILDQPIYFNDHCFGCTAGAGSSCGGSLV